MMVSAHRCKFCNRVRIDASGEPPCDCHQGEELRSVILSYPDPVTGKRRILATFPRVEA